MFVCTAVHAALGVVEENDVIALCSSQAGENRDCKSMCSTVSVLGFVSQGVLC
jgi:D-arabinose 5-phosphate isomerase GutQ